MKTLLVAGAATFLAVSTLAPVAMAQSAGTAAAPGTTTEPSTTTKTLPKNTTDAQVKSGEPAPAAVSTDGNSNTGHGPAKGANSFTESQAQGRIADAGYSSVAGLKKDNDGIWRGTAMKDGQQVNVWLDYTGAVGKS